MPQGSQLKVHIGRPIADRRGDTGNVRQTAEQILSRFQDRFRVINNPVVMRSKERKTFAAVESCRWLLLAADGPNSIVVVTGAFSVIDLY